MEGQKVDVGIAFYGKPYHTIVAIKTLARVSGQHIDKFILSRNPKQPHNDYSGIFKVIDHFRNDPAIKLEIDYPQHDLGVGVKDIGRAKRDQAWRRSIMYQYALETTDKKYLCVMHNDMLFHADMIGRMLIELESGPDNLVGAGSVGQCWSCPAGPDWGNVCNSNKMNEYIPTKQEALELSAAYATPRRDIQLRLITDGRVHPLPECRLNEYCSLINVQKYRQETIPNGDIGCFGGCWEGVDNATNWSYEMYQKGYRFKHVPLEDYCLHAPFDPTGSGTQSYSRADTYWMSEEKAKEYLISNFGPVSFSGYVTRANMLDTVRRKSWLGLIHTFGLVKRMVGKS